SAGGNALWQSGTGSGGGGEISSNGPLLGSAQRLYPAEHVASSDGQFNLVYQTDGDLVLRRADGSFVWHSGTGGSSPGYAEMQPDGNLVVYNADTVPLFWTNTDGHSGAVLYVGSDGVLTVTDLN